MTTIRMIEASDTISLRKKILRPNSPIEDCNFPGDLSPQTFHLGAFVKYKLVAICSLYLENHPLLKKNSIGLQFRLRGMCTEESYRRQNIGKSLLHYTFQLLREKEVVFLWCNARVNVLCFYKKAFFYPLGETFQIPTIGPHQVMVFDFRENKIPPISYE